MEPQDLFLLSDIVNIMALSNSMVQASSINAELMVKDSGRSPASKVAPLLSGSWLLSAEKSRNFNFTAQLLLSNITFLTKFEIFLVYVHIAVPLKEKEDSLQTFIEHVQYTNNM